METAAKARSREQDENPPNDDPLSLNDATSSAHSVEMHSTGTGKDANDIESVREEVIKYFTENEGIASKPGKMATRKKTFT